MAGPRRSARNKAAAPNISSPQEPPKQNKKPIRRVQDMIPDDVYDMINEAVAEHPEYAEERPLKRRRARGSGAQAASVSVEPEIKEKRDGASVEKDSIDELFEPPTLTPSQTVDISESESDDDDEFEDVDINAQPYKSAAPEASEDEEDDAHMDLNLTTAADTTPKATLRKKARIFSKQERQFHLFAHKMHFLCLLRSVKTRNNWCNDAGVQKTLLPLLSAKDRQWFKTQPEWTQFRRTESIKKGLDIANRIFLANFTISARGMRRAYWDDEGTGKKFTMPPDADSILDIEDFRMAAKNMEGSRDVGAMLYCALLRACGLDVRLTCSLQLLPITAGSKARPAPRGVMVSKPPPPEPEPLPPTPTTIGASAGSLLPPSADPYASRRRFGGDVASALMIRQPPPSRAPPTPKKKRIAESPYPVFWVEVLDEAHHRWMPVDPLVTQSIDKRLKFEPPAADSENNMNYVISFDHDGYAKDVTKRYTTWFLAKTRKTRVESTDGGETWLRRALRRYKRRLMTDLDGLEDAELADFESRERMPTSMVDFKDHPRYVLERDLRRNEVLIEKHEVAKVATGKAKNGKKNMEPVYRRSDVRVVRSSDWWYRNRGREVKPGAQPLRIRVSNKKRLADDEEPDEETALYMEEQTVPYVAPPVVNGRVPKNMYGNLDLYVPSMVPPGGVHLPYPETSRAAKVLGIDYADAVTGFEFRGRHGTAVVKGAVVAAEYKEAVEAVIEGFRDEEREAEENRRAVVALKMWRKFFVGLKIKERVDAIEIEGKTGREEREEREADEDEDADMADDGKGMESEEYDLGDEDYNVDEEGGFFPDDDMEGGGFLP